MKRRNGHLADTPFLSFAMRTLSLRDGAEGGGGGGKPPEIAPEVKKAISDEAVAAFKATLPKVPEKYNLKVPDKSSLDATVLERTSAIAREMGLTSDEHAQRLVDLSHGELSAFMERTLAEHKQQVSKWEADALAAKDLGNGDAAKLQALVARATAFTAKRFPEAVRTLLNDHGIGSHPDFLRAIIALADLSKEDGLSGGNEKGTSAKSHAERIYPNQGKK